jgi:hypothetical protein
VHVGVVGHRSIDHTGAVFTAQACRSLLDTLPSPEIALSALAEGADTLFAQAALERGIALHAFRPHDEYAHDFASPDALGEYRRLTSAASLETKLPFRRRSDNAYRAAMRAIVDTSDVLVAVWDEVELDAVGGTADTVRYARTTGRRTILVNPVSLHVRHE